MRHQSLFLNAPVSPHPFLIARAAIQFAVLALLVVITCPGCRSQFIFHPDRVIRETPADAGLSYETIFFETEDRVRLSAWWVPVEEQTAVVLFFHGNGGNISHFLDPVKAWNSMRLSTFSVDYRGYGMSGGSPSERGIYRDAEAAWKYLVEQRSINSRNIIIYGKSLGGSVAAHLAREHTPAALVIDSSFTRIAAVAQELFPWAPAELILGNAFNTQEYIGKVKCPVLIIHSRDDEMIPFHHGQALFDAAPEPKELLVVSGSHNGGFQQSLPVYEPALKSFISKNINSK